MLDGGVHHTTLEKVCVCYNLLVLSLSGHTDLGC